MNEINENLEKLFDEWCEKERERRGLKTWQSEYKNFKNKMKYVKKLIFDKFEVKDYDSLKKIIEEGKLKGLGIANRSKIREFIDYVDEIRQQKLVEQNEVCDELDELLELNNLEEIRNNKKENIKNNYIELIRNELSIVEIKLSQNGIGDEDLEDLHKVYEILRGIL